MDVHLYVSYRQYTSNVNSDFGLKYCHRNFLLIVKEIEYFYISLTSLATVEIFHIIYIVLAIEENCIIPKFCCSALTKYFIRLFIKARINPSVKAWNNHLETMKKE